MRKLIFLTMFFLLSCKEEKQKSIIESKMESTIQMLEEGRKESIRITDSIDQVRKNTKSNFSEEELRFGDSLRRSFE